MQFEYPSVLNILLRGVARKSPGCLGWKPKLESGNSVFTRFPMCRHHATENASRGKHGFGPEGRCPFTFLGVDSDSSLDDLRKAYFLLAKRTHPDTGGKFGDSDAFLELSAAFEAAVDAKKRGLLGGAGEVGVAERNGTAKAPHSREGMGTAEKMQVWMERQKALREFFTQEDTVRRQEGGSFLQGNWGDYDAYMNLFKRRLSEERSHSRAGTDSRCAPSYRTKSSDSASSASWSRLQPQDNISEAEARNNFLNELAEFGLPKEAFALYSKGKESWCRCYSNKRYVKLPFVLAMACLVLTAGAVAMNTLSRG